MATVELNGTIIEYVERGHGEKTVVLVHGSASDHRTWHAQLDAFAAKYRTVAFSRRYHWPNLPIATGSDYVMGEHVDDLRALVKSLGNGPVHLVGHSYGAFVSLLLAIKEPALVRSLVLAEPPAITLFVSYPPRPLEILGLLLRRPRVGFPLAKFGATGVGPATSKARQGDMVEAMRIFGRAVLTPAFYDRLSVARLEQVKDNAIAAEFLGSGFPPLPDDDVRRIQTPVLLVAGALSPAFLRRILDRLGELLPNADRVEIAGASHIMHEDNNEDFNAAVLSFLDGHTT